jgi:hypothetical protein
LVYKKNLHKILFGAFYVQAGIVVEEEGGGGGGDDRGRLVSRGPMRRLSVAGGGTMGRKDEDDGTYLVGVATATGLSDMVLLVAAVLVGRD